MRVDYCLLIEHPVVLLHQHKIIALVVLRTVDETTFKKDLSYLEGIVLFKLKLLLSLYFNSDDHLEAQKNLKQTVKVISIRQEPIALSW